MVANLKRIARGLCPPALLHALRFGLGLLRPVVVPDRKCSTTTDPRRRLSTLVELDEELERARVALPAPGTGSCDESFAVLDSFVFVPDAERLADPFAPEYREQQMAFYHFLSGRDRYDAHTCEQMELESDKRHRPFPYYTRSTTMVGEQLMAVGFVVRALGLAPRGRVLELGAGFGMLTLEMLRTDLDVTAVEINPLYSELLNERAQRENLTLNIVCAGMLDYRPAERFDRVVFYESFHHCDDHVAMIARFDELVCPGGEVLFAGEPIQDDFPVPWGVRCDGRSLWAIRQFGWLELGFRTDYFLDLLLRHGWCAQLLFSADVPWQRVFLARRVSETIRIV